MSERSDRTRRFRRGLRALVPVLALAAWGVATQPRAELVDIGPDVFNTYAVRSTGLNAFPKWRGALERYFGETRVPEASCRSGLFTTCHLQDWRAFLHSVAGAAPEEKISRVNAFHNRARYILDIVNWRIDDYWATPLQFFDRDGDCEDYAIAKFMSLRALGFSNDQLRIVVLRDLNLKLAHAVLVVKLDGVNYVLDNQIATPVRAELIHHYQPIYSVNETHWWLHRRG